MKQCVKVPFVPFGCVLKEFPSCAYWVKKVFWFLTKKQPKSEWAKSEWAKSEQAKSEQAKSEQAKSEQAKSEQLKFPQITGSSMELFFSPTYSPELDNCCLVPACWRLFVFPADIFRTSENNSDCRTECTWNDYEMSISYSQLSAKGVPEAIVSAPGNKTAVFLQYVNPNILSLSFPLLRLQRKVFCFVALAIVLWFLEVGPQSQTLHDRSTPIPELMERPFESFIRCKCCTMRQQGRCSPETIHLENCSFSTGSTTQ